MLGQNPGVQPFPPPPFGFPAGKQARASQLPWAVILTGDLPGGLPPPPFGMPGGLPAGMIPRKYYLHFPPSHPFNIFHQPTTHTKPTNDLTSQRPTPAAALSPPSPTAFPSRPRAVSHSPHQAAYPSLLTAYSHLTAYHSRHQAACQCCHRIFSSRKEELFHRLEDSVYRRHRKDFRRRMRIVIGDEMETEEEEDERM
jgi:hypothetical protein